MISILIARRQQTLPSDAALSRRPQTLLKAGRGLFFVINGARHPLRY
jgi:hypothetical protein